MFKELAHNLAMHIAAMNPVDKEDLLKQNYVKDDSLTIESFIKSVIAKIGEKYQG